MRSVGIITDPTMTLDMLRLVLRGRFEVATTETDLLVIRDGDNVAWLASAGSSLEEYDEGELDVVGMDRMRFFDLRYRSITFLKKVLLAVADDRRVWVDNDRGMILAGPELVARLEREPDWLMGLPTVTGD